MNWIKQKKKSKKDLDQLEKELKSQKKKSKNNPEIETKEKILNLLKEKINIIKKKYNGEDIDEDDIRNSRSALQELDEILKKNKNNDNSEQERELYSEEKEIIEEWEKRK